MHLIITDAWVARRRAIHLGGYKLVAGLLLAGMLVAVASVSLYHWVFIEGARKGWPVFDQVVRLVGDGAGGQEAYMRERLDVMARRLGQMQARLAQLESLGERVAGLAGVEPLPAAEDSAGGGTLLSPRNLSAEELDAVLDAIDSATLAQTDWLTVIESRLYDQRIRRYMVPTETPVPGVALGSRFGWRIDPFTGQKALHSGLDFPAHVGTPILAAAGGIVVSADRHPAYGRMVEIDHGDELLTRYAHASRLHVKKGDLVRRGQKIAEVGSTGRSTGPHLHFEVLVAGVPQDPKRFLDAGEALVRQQESVVKAPQSSRTGLR
jgi:murein DD-endopeptidase MepM/ murein hydrolase activator NlpD